jgi:lambda repressor-like predicted transcriptional regulator
VKHGTLTAYAKHGCRCEPCRAANAKASKAWRRDNYLGIVKLVDAQPLKDHVAMLTAAGMSFPAIALTAGWASRNALADSMRRKRVTSRTLARVLAVHPEVDNRRDAYADATGSARRLQALAINGWPTRALAQRLGHKDPATIQRIASGKTPTVRLRTKDGIRRLFDELWDRPGPSKRTAAIAEARGWIPALAWDDDLIDSPEHQPADVRRRGISGGRSGITLEDIEEAREQGYGTAEQIGWRLGASREAVAAILSRANRLAS